MRGTLHVLPALCVSYSSTQVSRTILWRLICDSSPNKTTNLVMSRSWAFSRQAKSGPLYTTNCPPSGEMVYRLSSYLMWNFLYKRELNLDCEGPRNLLKESKGRIYNNSNCNFDCLLDKPRVRV
ncbi:hypothetical protein F4810DRAFT_152925 [Camillea tinctor]|nr:hypothetical protein F4810DRAFT_152925 [Camillea tinctor]